MPTPANTAKAVMPEQNQIPADAPNPATYATEFHKRVGIDPVALRKFFEFPKDDAGKFLEPDAKSDQGKLLAHLRGMVQDARRQSFRNWRVWAAVDEAWQTSFRQVDLVLIKKVLAGEKIKDSDCMKQFESWGLPESLYAYKAKEKGQEVKKLRRSVYHQVYIPLVKSVVLARCAKIFNDRFGNEPLFVYDPVRSTEEAEQIGEITTQGLRTMCAQYGYRDTGRAMILQALKYTHCLMFPAEAWHCEWDVDEDGKEFPRKEGLRYNIPHPTRMGWDQKHRPSTFNTDTGCQWSAYWDIYNYGDVACNPDFFNTAAIPYGQNWLSSGLSASYFKYFNQCLMDYPWSEAEIDTAEKNDRLKSSTIYSEGDFNKALFLTNLFVKLDPKQWGIVKATDPKWNGEHSRKLWFRFVVANDQTVVSVEVLPYAPTIYCGCDTDETMSLSSSMAIDAMPFQQLAENMTSQIVRSMRLNSTKIIPYDIQQITSEQLDSVEDESEVCDRRWLPFDGRQAMTEQLDPTKMFAPISFGNYNVQEQISTLNTVFNVMERTLRMSAQEVGAVAGHIQTAEEIRVVTGNTTAYVEYTASFTDSAVDAWKRQIWTASSEFADDEFTVTISRVPQAMAEKLKTNYGFKLVDLPGSTVVKGKRSMMVVETFLSQRESVTRSSHPQVATVIMQTLQAVAANQFLAPRLGPEWFAKNMARASRLAGAPEDFEIKIPPEASTLAEIRSVGEQLQKAVKQISAMAVQETEKAIGPALEQQGKAMQETQQASLQLAQKQAAGEQAVQGVQQTLGEVQAAVLELAKRFEAMSQMLEPPAPQPIPIAPPQPPPQPPPLVPAPFPGPGAVPV